MPNRKVYSSDLSDRERQILEPLLSLEKPGGRHRAYSLRKIVNATQFVLSNGSAGRSMPNDLLHWEAAYHYFSRWKKMVLGLKR